MDYNKSIFVGKVKGAPQTIQGAQGEAQVQLTFVVNDRVQDNNQQWVDRPMELPLFARGKKAEVIQKYVVDGQELLVECMYKNWRDQQGNLQHAFILMNVQLGFKPRAAADAPQAAPQGAPPM